MKVNILSRIGAFIIDIVLLTLMGGIISGIIPQSAHYREIKEKESKLIGENIFAQFDDNTKMDEYYQLKYEIDKETIHITLISCVLSLAYFGTFAFYNDGKTVGKMLLKIKIENVDKRNNMHLMYLLRSFLINGVFSSLLLVLGVLLFNYQNYTTYYYVVSGIYASFLLVTCIISITREDGRGIHDLLCGTEVIKNK